MKEAMAKMSLEGHTGVRKKNDGGDVGSGGGGGVGQLSAEKVVVERILIRAAKLVTVALIGRRREETAGKHPHFGSFCQFPSIQL